MAAMHTQAAISRFVDRKMHFLCQNVYLTALAEELNLAVTDLFLGTYLAYN